MDVSGIQGFFSLMLGLTFRFQRSRFIGFPFSFSLPSQIISIYAFYP